MLAFLAVAVVATVTGCRSIYRADPVVDERRNRTDIFTEPVCSFARFKNWIIDNHPLYINPTRYCLPGETNSLFSQASYRGTDTNELSKARQARNLLQNLIIGLAYENSGQHAAGIKATENGANLLLGGATIGLSGGASVAAAATAKALAAAATGTAGGRALFNDETFRDNLAEAMFKAMDTDREKFLVEVILPNQTNSVLDYDVARAISDAQVYNEKASFYYELSTVLQDIGKATDARKAKIDAAYTNLMNK
jgi:hypothetical protein